MSTRAFIGTVTNDGSLTAVYSHNDGYPTWTGKHLAQLITTHGADHVATTIAAHPAWSGIDTRTIDTRHITPDLEAPHGTPARAAWLHHHLGYHTPDGDYTVIPGFGVAYTHPEPPMTGGLNYDTETGFLDDITDCEWGWLLDLTHRTLICVSMKPFTDRFEVAATISFSDLPNANWATVECGENWERCRHVAAAHVEELPRGAHRLSMSAWTGANPLTPRDAISVTIEGREFVLAGGGRTPGFHDASLPTYEPGTLAHNETSWYAVARPRRAVTLPVGYRRRNQRVTSRDILYVPLEGPDHAPLPGVTYTYPPVAADALTPA